MRAASREGPITAGELSLRRELFPQGRPLAIVTNELRVLEVADDLWGRYPRLGAGVPANLRVAVVDEEPASGDHRRDYDGDLFTFSSSNGLATADLRRASATVRITASCAADRDCLRYEFLEPLGYSLVAAQHFTLLHAAAIAIEDKALLLCGEPGAGKTCLAYGAAKRGWSFLSGDATALEREEPALGVVGRPFEIRFRHSAADLFPELARFRRTFRPEGKKDILLKTEQLPIPISLRAAPAAVVFLERWERDGIHIEPVAPASARRRLGVSVCYGGVELRNRQMQALERILGLPLVRLRYSSLDQAEDTLRGLLDRGGVAP